MKCAVKDCPNRWGNGKKEGISFHVFPKNRYREWLAALGMQTDVGYPLWKKVCSIHFSQESFIKIGLLRRLKDNAIPIIVESHQSTDLQKSMPSSTDLPSTSGLQRNASCDKEENRMKLLKRRFLDRSTSPSTMTSSSDSSGIRKRVKIVQTFHSYSSTFDHLESNLKTIKKRNRILRSKYHGIKKTARRLKIKVQSLHCIINDLRNKMLISGDASEHLTKTFSSVPRAIMARILKSNRQSASNSKYPQSILDFSMTLMFYSQKAYEFVREKFDLCLPHPSTIRKIYSGVQCKPGFTGASFELLKLKAEKYRISNKELICSLIIDEMAIRKQIISDGCSSYGYINMGCDNVDDELSPATEALFFLVVCHTEHWKLPIAYFLIKSLNAAEKANLVQEALSRLGENNVRITSVTCDGPSVNVSMLKHLGCTITSDQYHTYFTNEINPNNKTYVLLDACHMLKLMRNAFAEMKMFLDCEGNLIEWKYVELLYEFEQMEGLSIATKLKKNHMEWKRQKMKVKLAAQTLSSSVADAIEYLMKDLKLPQFKDAEHTIKFIRIIDRSFDLLNSRSPVAKGYKAPMKKGNENIWKPFLMNAIKYFKNCRQVNGLFLTSSPRKTPFIGFIISLYSVMGIFDDYVKTDRLRYLLTYKCSQDHLELLFCNIRSKNGWNNNPNALQLERTYRQILFHSQLKGIGGNCEAIDSTTILALPSNKSERESTRSLFAIDFSLARKFDMDIPAVIEEHDYFIQYSPSLSENLNHVVAYICGYVIRMVQKKIRCGQCLEAIQDSLKNVSDSTKLLSRKDRGGLLWPAEGTLAVCLKCEINVRKMLFVTNNKVPKEEGYIVNLANSISQIFYDKNIFPSLENHYFEYEFSSNHVYLLIRTISLCYLKIRFYNLSRKQTECIEGERIRQIFSKLILFRNQ